MQVSEKIQDGIQIFTVEGEIDLESSPSLRTHLRASALKKSARVLLDFTSVTYIDSSGLATLLEFYQATRNQDGRLVLAGLTKRVQNALEIVRLQEIFTIHPDVETASKALAL